MDPGSIPLGLSRQNANRRSVPMLHESSVLIQASSSSARPMTFSALPPSAEQLAKLGLTTRESKYAYYLNRGNGTVTRLIPADTLPPLAGIPQYEEPRQGMEILPALYGMTPFGVQNMNNPVTVMEQHQHQVPRPSMPQKKDKEYCDHWIHTGDCRFQQTGCRYKHEMPLDKATQERLGLSNGTPKWWKQHHAQMHQHRQSMPAGLMSPTTDRRSMQDGAAIVQRKWRNSADATPVRYAPRQQDMKHGSIPISHGDLNICRDFGPIAAPSRRGRQ